MQKVGSPKWMFRALHTILTVDDIVTLCCMRNYGEKR